ncbi:hypothetical protein [Bacillus testis]|uniref:hypothetical protein n=1 Tax=Bacillus testis TaxID=1622072 RepID=UPI000ACBE5A7|nr:hypothetical protein [Bacillus testis]
MAAAVTALLATACMKTVVAIAYVDSLLTILTYLTDSVYYILITAIEQLVPVMESIPAKGSNSCICKKD